MQTSKTKAEANKALLNAKVNFELKEIDEDRAIKLVFATVGEYPDGTKWERSATPEEIGKFKKWSV